MQALSHALCLKKLMDLLFIHNKNPPKIKLYVRHLPGTLLKISRRFSSQGFMKIYLYAPSFSHEYVMIWWRDYTFNGHVVFNHLPYSMARLCEVEDHLAKPGHAAVKMRFH